MKTLLLSFLLLIGFGAFAQTYDTLPTGSKPYGNQLYLSPDGMIIGGTGSAKFRVIGTKKYVDSLLALKAPLSPSGGYVQASPTSPQPDSLFLGNVNDNVKVGQSGITFKSIGGTVENYLKVSGANMRLSAGNGLYLDGSLDNAGTTYNLLTIDSDGRLTKYPGNGFPTGNYIQNNNTGTSQSASFNITGTGRFDNGTSTTLINGGTVFVGEQLSVPLTLASDSTSKAASTGFVHRLITGSKIYVNVKDYGAKGDGINDDSQEINAAIQAAYDKTGGTVFFPTGKYKTTSKIIARRSVILRGEGGFDYSGMPSQFGTCIVPDAAFSDNVVIEFDSQQDNTPLLSGAGLTNIAIDMDAISNAGKTAIAFRSVTNIGLVSNIAVFKLNHGTALLMEGSAYSGSFATDGIDVVGFFSYGKTSGYSSNIPKLILRGNVNEINFRGCKFQSASGAIAGTISAQIESGSRGITFDGCSFAGNEIGAKIISNTEALSPPEWIRFINCTFETYRYGITVDATGSNANFFPKRISVEDGNRFLQTVGADCRNVLLGKSIGVIVKLDEFIEAGTSGISKLIELTDGANGATVVAQPTQVLNNSGNSIVNGRVGNSNSFNRLDVTGANGADDVVIKNTASNTANGVIRWQGADGVDKMAIASNYTVGDDGNTEFLNGNTLRMLIQSGGNVGIGTSSPATKLEVNGKIKATSINFSGLDVYADDSAAGTGGLIAGDCYRTSTGELRIKL